MGAATTTTMTDEVAEVEAEAEVEVVAEEADPPAMMVWRPFRHGDEGAPRLCPLDEAGVEREEDGTPINPYDSDHAQLGRGALADVGPQHEADPVVTRPSPTREGEVDVLVLATDDDTALPSGPVATPGDAFATPSLKEVVRRATMQHPPLGRLFAEDATPLYAGGAADDGRCTRNAWVETVSYHAHLPCKAAWSALDVEEEEEEGGEDKDEREATTTTRSPRLVWRRAATSLSSLTTTRHAHRVREAMEAVGCACEDVEEVRGKAAEEEEEEENEGPTRFEWDWVLAAVVLGVAVAYVLLVGDEHITHDILIPVGK
jgi:hypothetical protein